MSKSRWHINPIVLVGVPTLEKRPISWEWMDYFMSLDFGLGVSVARSRVAGQIVADARNEIVRQALACNADYVLFISDDVLVPPNLFKLLHRHREHLVTGVYWTKTFPTEPYLWNGLCQGPYLDWKLGEYFPVDWAGCDALLAHTDVFRAIPEPWFSHDWVFEPGQRVPPYPTEDVYFYAKARQAGFQLYCDTLAQCDHQDRATGRRFGLTVDMPQAQPDAPHPSTDVEIRVADLGAGLDTPYFGSQALVRRFDADPSTQPDVRCDLRAIPEPAELYDIVHARHVLEHFMPDEAPALIREWTRILKVGGQLRISVPNIAYAAREILKADADPDYNAGLYPHWQWFGRQDGSPNEVHRNGFTQHGLRRLLTHCGLGDVRVEVGGEASENIEATAVKVRDSQPFQVGPAWRDAVGVEVNETAVAAVSRE